MKKYKEPKFPKKVRFTKGSEIIFDKRTYFKVLKVTDIQSAVPECIGSMNWIYKLENIDAGGGGNGGIFSVITNTPLVVAGGGDDFFAGYIFFRQGELLYKICDGLYLYHRPKMRFLNEYLWD